MGGSRIVIPVLASILILGTLGLSQDALAYDVCSDDGRCAHETMTRYGVEVYNNNTDTDITTGQLELLEEGAGHEDVWDHLFAHQEILGIFEDLFEIGATITMGHFWDPDQQKICLDPFCISPLFADYIDDYDPDRDIILDGAAKSIMDADFRDGWESGWQKTEMYWSMSLGEFTFNNLDGSCPDEGDFEGCGAYHYLGHIAHHFGDNTVPTHAHQSAHDPFSTGTDAFENWMSGKKFPPAGYLWKDDAEEAELKQKVGVYVPRSTGIDPLAAMTGDADIDDGDVSGPVDTQREKLYWLLYTENQIADYFASDRVDGDGSSFFSDGTGFDPEGWVQTDLNHLNSVVVLEDLPNDLFDLDSKSPGDFFNNNNDCDFFGDATCGNDDDGDLSKIREYSYLRGIRSIAGLMELYDQTVTTKPIIALEITKIHINDYPCDPFCPFGNDSLNEECDDFDILGNKGCDAYSKVTINGNFVTNVGQITENVEAGDTIEPKWRFGTELESETGFIPIIIEIVDQDSTLNEDDKIDITPGPGTGLILFVDVEKCIKNEPAAIQPFFVPCGSSITIDAGGGYGGTAGAKITFIVKALTTSPPSNLGPIADAGGPYLVAEGSEVILDGTGSSDPEGGTLTYDWDFDNDGEFDDATGATPTYDDVGDDKLVDIALRVIDDGGLTGFDFTTITINNVDPTIDSLSADDPINEGETVTVVGTASDPGWEDDLSATIDWDDGNGEQNMAEDAEENVRPDATLEFSASLKYGDDGTFNTEVCVEDDDGGEECNGLDIIVNNVEPTVEAGDDDSVNEGSLFTRSATFTDPGTDTWTGIVDWGDGTLIEPITTILPPVGPALPGNFSVEHIYADNGVYAVTITITDDDAGVGVDTFDVTVGNVVPSVEAGTDQEYVIHDVTSLDPAEYSDVGFDCAVCNTQENFTATLNWGEGPVEPLVVTEVPGRVGVLTTGTASGSHIYRLPGEYTVTVTVTDDDDGSTSDTLVNTILGARDLKNRAISILSPFSNEFEDVEESIKEIKKSLNTELWIDKVYLDQEDGEEVFDKEGEAVEELQELLEEDDDDEKSFSPELKAAVKTAIDLLVNADRVLTITLMLDASSAIAADPDDQEEVKEENEKASEEFAKGDANRDAGKFEEAIEHYENAWEHAGEAIKKATDNDDGDDDDKEDDD